MISQRLTILTLAFAVQLGCSISDSAFTTHKSSLKANVSDSDPNSQDLTNGAENAKPLVDVPEESPNEAVGDGTSIPQLITGAYLVACSKAADQLRLQCRVEDKITNRKIQTDEISWMLVEEDGTEITQDRFKVTKYALEDEWHVEISLMPDLEIEKIILVSKVESDDFVDEAVDMRLDSIVPAGEQNFSCWWMRRSPPYDWLWQPDISSKLQCYQLDTCNGGQGLSEGGCYKWAECATCQRAPWTDVSQP